MHSILTYQTENKRMGCINRDENATNNMVKLVNYYIKYQDRPEKYKRDYNINIKDDNPNLCKSNLVSNIVKPVKVQLQRRKNKVNN